MTEPKIELWVQQGNEKLKQTYLHNRVYASSIATFAMDMMKVSALGHVPNGETGSGHQKYRLISPEETIQRSVKIAELAFYAFKERRWITDEVPIADLMDDSVMAGFKP